MSRRNSILALDATKGALFLVGSIIINHFASVYADIWASNSVTDIVLDNIPVMDVDSVLSYGALFFAIFIVIAALFFLKRIPFILKSIALFIFVRSIFIMLTHLGPSPEKTPIDDEIFLGRLLSGNDLFFSGHTGLPFLLALIFWDVPLVRWISIGVSVIFGTAVLLGHLHYSIDVFSAFFITYSVFRMAQYFFAKDWEIARK